MVSPLDVREREAHDGASVARKVSAPTEPRRAPARRAAG